VKKPGRWIAAAELVETTRLFARSVAAIEPRWLEDIGGHLIKREQYEPQWDARRGEVIALERGSLYGLPLYSNRRVSYGPLEPRAAHEIFIRAALVQGELDTRAPFLAHNRRLVAEIERLEHKSRRPDILVDEQLIHAFYAERVPPHIYSAAAFEQWRVGAEHDDKRRLHLSREGLMRHEAAGITTENFPPQIELGPNRFALEYHFEPGSPRDGVTMTVPLALLNQVPLNRTEWLVPGLVKEKVRTLTKAIPQRLRHKLGGLDDFAAAFCGAVAPSDTPLSSALARYARAEFNVEVPLDAFRPDAVPLHLRMNFRVIDDTGRQRAMERDLAAIKRTLGEEAKTVLQQEAPVDEGTRYTGWTMGELPEIMEIRRGGHTLVGYPALVDAGDAVTLQVFESPEKAREAHAGGVRRLLAIAFRDRVRDLERTLAKDAALAPLAADVIRAAIDRVFLAESLPMTPAEFARRVDQGRSRFTLIAQEIARSAAQIQAERAALEKKLTAAEKAFAQPVADIRAQLARLLGPGWLARTPWERLQHLPRYLKAAALRLEKLRADPQRDQRLAAELAALELPFRRELGARSRNGAVSPELDQFGWLLEELRVSLFAQELRTPVAVSLKRLAKLWQSVRR
jgi:ATP-dependent helicase HrpA